MFKYAGRHSIDREALGIDIGPHTIKLVVLSESDIGLVLDHAFRIPTPDHAIENGVITDVDQIAKAIKHYIKMHGITATSVSMSVPTEQAIVRWIDLPNLSPDEIQAAAPFEARKYINYPMSQADVQVVPVFDHASEKCETVKALLVAAPKSVTRCRSNVAEAAGLLVNCIEVEAFALMRALFTPQMKRDMVWSSQSRAYVQIGNESSSMYVLQNSSIRFVRGLSWGSGRLPQALSSSLNCSLEQAGKIITSGYASISQNGNLMWIENEDVCETDVLVGELERLCKEIQRLVNYYLSLFPERSYEGILNQITLCGGAAGLNGLKDYLASRLEIEFNMGDPIKTKSIHVTPSTSSIVENYSSGLTVAVGLALGEITSNSVHKHDNTNMEYVWRRKAA